MGNKSVFLAVAAFLALPAAAALAEPAGLSASMRVALDEEPAFMLSGNGFNVFECRLSALDSQGASNAYAWAFVAPDAALYEGTRTAARTTSPNLLESVSDRSSVSGIVRASQPGGADNLPWTLMRARPQGESGLFAGVTSIQRVDTNGGIAPRTGCDAGKVGSEARVAYRASYYFYKRRGTS